MAPSDPFALVGTTLEQRVRIDSVVAEGGFGVVYVGLHLSLGVKVAVKVLRPLEGLDPEAWADAMARFIREAKAIARVKHPAVVGILESGITTSRTAPAGIPWMILEWIEGQNLRDELASRRGTGGRSPKDTLALLRPVLEAIAAAHDAGLAHRDLKPSNVMLEPGKGARVVDFGTAKILGDDLRASHGETATAETSRVFSVVCAAPEQLSGTRTSPATDVYALGLVLTEVLCDKAAYPEDDATARYSAAFDAHHRPTPGKLGVDVGAWEAVLDRALSVRPSDRQPNAGALLRDLEAALKTTENHRRTSEVGGTWRSGSRGATLAVLGVALLATGLGFGFRKRATPRAPGPSASSPCTGHRACLTRSGGEPAACRLPEGRCVTLTTRECTLLADDRARVADDTVWLGAMFPTTGGDRAMGLGNVHAVELARRDFAETMSGMASQREGDRARPFGLIVCDDTELPERAAAHLVAVGVPAVIGFRSGEEALHLASSVFLPSGILTMCAASSDALVTRIPQAPGAPRLVFRTTYDATSKASALAAFALSGVASQGGLRVALVHAKNAQGNALVDAATRDFAVPGVAYRDLPFDADAGAKDATSFASIVRGLVALQPHAVLFEGGRAAVEGIVAPTELAWPPSTPRPRWATMAAVGPDLLELVATDRPLARRVFGVRPVGGSPINLRFRAHHSEVFPEDDVILLGDEWNSSYDAFYLLAFATYAAGPARVTGASLSRAMGRLQPPGHRIEVGIAGIFPAYRELSEGRGIDFLGASGPLDFDLATGEAAFEQALLCVDFDAQGKARAIESGLVWSPADRRLTGVLGCRGR